ncbi:MAG: MlaD family protein [Candidatus Rokubacteria bacterium]|nr:MlaD family protein [Candidatus Rokubacteria bacterium]
MDGRHYALQLRIGAFVVISLVVFLGIIYLLGAQARYFERKYDLVAEFTEVGGLIEGATVRLAGVQIGRVTNVALAPQAGGKVRVTLTIARRFSDRIRQSSEARIVTQGLLGDKLVEITMGMPDSRPLEPGGTLQSREPFEVGRIFAEGTDALSAINTLVRSLQASLDRLNTAGTLEDLDAAVKSTRRVTERLEGLGRDGAFGDVAAAARSARRITEQVEKGGGWLHTLVYEEPEALRRLNTLLGSAQEVLARTRTGDSAVGALLSPESGRSVRALLAAMDAFGRGAELAGGGQGLLSTLLFDPQYKPIVEDLQMVARNFRELSERLARGQGLLAGLLREQGDSPLDQAAADFRTAMANLRTITDHLKAGEGTLGGLLEDPTVYENIAAFLEGAQRSFLLRSLIRSTIQSGGDGTSPSRAGGR